MELRHLRYFVGLAEALHFRKAAEILCVTQSTISHQIRQLEDELGTTLFHRTGRHVQLAPAGSLFLTYARRILREVDAAEIAVHDLDALKRGSLRIGVIHTLMRPVVMPALTSFIQRYPGVKVTILEATTSKIEGGLIDGSLDFGIAVAPAKSTELVLEPLFDEDFVVVVNKRHELASNRHRQLSDIVKYPLVMLDQSFATRRVIDFYFESGKYSPTISIESNTVETVLEVVSSCSLATVIPSSALLGQTELISIKLDRSLLKRSCSIFWPRTNQRSVAALTLAAELAKHSKIFTANERLDQAYLGL